MKQLIFTRHALLAASSLATLAWFAAPANAQESAVFDYEAGEPITSTGDRQEYPADYFSRFAPRTALDMIERIPGFTINRGDENARGFGQADQNVIVNGQRLSSKSESIEGQLRRIPAGEVQRIEILDGTTLDIPGLSGQVANVIYANNGTSGQFRWNTGFRAHNTEAQLFGGDISVTGSKGRLGYTISLSNDNERYGADGPTLITDGDGNLIETQSSKFSGKFDNPKLAASLAYDFGGETTANLNLSVRRDSRKNLQPETGISPDGLIRERSFRETDHGPQYEIGGDIEFPLGPGKLKLIGLERYERDDYGSELVDRFSSGAPATGFHFDQTNESGERIGRFEYGWNMWQADWQLSGEAAFNRFDRTSSFSELAPDGQFVELPFPGGNGGVTEDRYETILSVSKQLTPKLSVRLSGGSEFSKIEQTGSDANSRSFRRPKGSLSLAWKPASDFDIAVEFARRVSQLSFGDFLANVSLDNENQSGANNELVPYQSWNVEVEANKSFGPWGSIKLEAKQAWFEDFIDWFPLPAGGEARGNIGDAKRLHFEVNATLNLDPVGFKGARFDIQGVKRFLDVTDPSTNESRSFSYDQEGSFEINFRHDIPSSDWAWGTRISHYDQAPYARRSEVGRNWEGPVFGTLFVEHKDVFGLTVHARAGNLLGARNRFRRTVFDGDRPDAPILFSEDMDRRIGPIFRLTISGNI